MYTKLRLTIALLLILLAHPASTRESTKDTPHDAYIAGSYRVFTGAGERSSLDDVISTMGKHQVVFIGEVHDDPTGHMLEALLFERAFKAYGTADSADQKPANQKPRPVALSLEFFEHDVQEILDEYLAGLITEKAFKAASRPWTRYATDYRTAVEFAKENGLTVIAANAPRRYAGRVTKHGRESLTALSENALATLAPLPYGKPSKAYRDQWIQVISEVMQQEGTKCGRPIPEGKKPAHVLAPGTHDNMGNQLDSQVLWDATMAHWIADYLRAEPNALVLHMVGGFHVARGTGTPEHLEAYLPGTSRLLISMRPVEDVDHFEPAPAGTWGDFVIQTDQALTLESLECVEYLAELETK